MRSLYILLLLALPARADNTALPCRPTIACTADVVPPGSFEVELGYLYQKGAAAQHTLPILAKLTLATWVQLQIGGNGLTFINGTEYLDDLVAGFKFHLWDQSSRVPSLSWSVALSAPLDAPLRTYDLFWTAYVTKDFRWLHADLNLGLDLWRMEGATKPQPWVALALSVALPRNFIVMAESYYFFDASPITPKDGGLLAAIAYTPRPWVVFDAGANLGYFPSLRSISAFVGMTILPVRLW